VAAQVVTIPAFRTVFECVIRYYPVKKGVRLLFQKDNDGNTPLQLACQKYGRDEVMNTVDEILPRYAQDTPLNSMEALIVAAVDDTIHFDCVYFLIRREPDLVLRLLPWGRKNNNNNGGGGGNDDDGNDDDGDENDRDNVEDDDNEGGDNGDDDNGDDDNGDDNGDSDSDNDNDNDGGTVDSKTNGAGTRKRKRSVGSIDE